MLILNRLFMRFSAELAEKAALIEEVSSEKMPHDFLQLEALYREICGIITEERL